MLKRSNIFLVTLRVLVRFSNNACNTMKAFQVTAYKCAHAGFFSTGSLWLRLPEASGKTTLHQSHPGDYQLSEGELLDRKKNSQSNKAMKTTV